MCEHCFFLLFCLCIRTRCMHGWQIWLLDCCPSFNCASSFILMIFTSLVINMPFVLQCCCSFLLCDERRLRFYFFDRYSRRSGIKTT